jgi:DNA-binding NarL/FixJ family response regulator
MLVDRHPLWMETVADVAERAGVEVRAKLASSTAACAQLVQLRPALLITGIDMQADDEMDGIALARHAREQVPGIRTIVLSMHEDRKHVDAALAAGADAYVFKTAHPDDLLSAIRQAFQHSVYLAGPRPPVESPRDTEVVARTSGLTRREHEILQLVAEGHSNAQLARMLWVTEQTVKFHLSNVYRKLGVANRTEAGRWAQLHGLLGTAHSRASRAA